MSPVVSIKFNIPKNKMLSLFLPKLHVSINILMKSHQVLSSNEIPAIFSEDMGQMPKVLSKKNTIVKQCFWIQIKFITEDSNAIHTIIKTR
jgi:hypothetical protein